MLQLLYKYLILNKKVVLPGVGIFHIKRHPSSLDFSNKQFLAPSAEIAFTENGDEDDKKFYRFIVSSQQMDEQSAVQNFNRFVAGIKEKLQSGLTVQLPEIGTLTKDRTGHIYFKQTQPLNSFYENVASERVMQKISTESGETSLIKDARAIDDKVQVEETEIDAKPSKNQKDYWWVYALVVASIAVAAIAYYYYQNGSLR